MDEFGFGPGEDQV
jgi:hypothetical protein